MLKATNIKKSFGSLEVLKGVDLSISKGDVTSILGPSGFRQIHIPSLH